MIEIFTAQEFRYVIFEPDQDTMTFLCDQTSPTSCEEYFRPRIVFKANLSLFTFHVNVQSVMINNSGST
jgi:hypothetical protein